MNNKNFSVIINLGLILVGFVVVTRVLDLFSDFTGEKLQEGEDKQDKDNQNTTQGELNKDNLSYPDSEYFDIADTIYTALQAGYTEDEDAIYTAFRRLKNNDDYLKLKLVYGKRPIGFYGFRNDLNLVQSLRSLLNDTEIYYVNRILAVRNIKYRI